MLLVLLAPLGSTRAEAQNLGAIEISGRAKIGTKIEKITRKRFYLFRGGLEANRAMLDRVKASAGVSRDCFYCRAKASPEYIAWLKAENCESPFCREITADDITKVPEFQAAYQKGLKQFRGKTDIAQKWVTTNLPPELRDGFYRQEKTLLDTLLAGAKPLQSSMTDIVTIKAIFIDIALTAGKTSETFLISNLVPIEIGGKGYVWACELPNGPNAKPTTLQPTFPVVNKSGQKCEVYVRDLPVCAGGSCEAK